MAVAKEAIRCGPQREQQEDKQHPSRIQADQVEEVDFSSFNEVEIPINYDCSEGHKIAAWLHNICDKGEPIQAISWFQLNVLFEYETNSQGVRYNKSRKKWENLSASLKSQDFVARTKSFSKWNARTFSSNVKTNHSTAFATGERSARFLDDVRTDTHETVTADSMPTQSSRPHLHVWPQCVVYGACDKQAFGNPSKILAFSAFAEALRLPET